MVELRWAGVVSVKSGLSVQKYSHGPSNLRILGDLAGFVQNGLKTAKKCKKRGQNAPKVRKVRMSAATADGDFAARQSRRPLHRGTNIRVFRSADGYFGPIFSDFEVDKPSSRSRRGAQVEFAFAACGNERPASAAGRCGKWRQPSVGVCGESST